MSTYGIRTFLPIAAKGEASVWRPTAVGEYSAPTSHRIEKGVGIIEPHREMGCSGFVGVQYQSSWDGYGALQFTLATAGPQRQGVHRRPERMALAYPFGAR